MKDFSKKLIWPLILIIFLDIFIIGQYRLANQQRVIFCDVGQGDGAMIVMGATQIIVDGGPDNSLAGCVGKYMPYFDRKIEYLIISHPDADHFVGAVEILRRYFVERVIVNGDESDSPEWREFKKLAQGKITVANENFGIDLPVGKIDFLYPDEKHPVPEVKHETNDYSLVFKFIFPLVIKGEVAKPMGDSGISILFTGDATETTEENLLGRGADVSSDILKVGHHGSKFSSTKEFLKAVGPKLAVISAGADNKYGHPANIILKRLENLGIKYLRTDESGDIIVNFE